MSSLTYHTFEYLVVELGYLLHLSSIEIGVKGYKFYRLTTNRIHLATKAVFDETYFPKRTNQERQQITPVDGWYDVEVDLPATPFQPLPKRRRRTHDDESLPSEEPPAEEAEDDEEEDDDDEDEDDSSKEDTDEDDDSDSNDAPRLPPDPQQVPAAAEQRQTSQQSGNRHSGRSNFGKPPTFPGQSVRIAKLNRESEYDKSWGKAVSSTKGSSQVRLATKLRTPGPSLASQNNYDNFCISVTDDVDEARIAKMCREGGVELCNYLLANAVNAEEHLHAEPREWTYRDILRMPDSEKQEWTKACNEELDALKKRQVYSVVDLPKGRKAARLVAKGFLHIEGIDYNEVFSPVVRFESVRLMLALAALKGWHMSALDVRNAFLYGPLDVEIYMEQPEGFKVKGQEDKVLRLHKALYGLKQAALAWWKELASSVLQLGFQQLNADTGVFVYRSKKGVVILVAYVDDIIFFSSNKKLMLEKKAEMRIKHLHGKIYLDQTSYLEKIVLRFSMQNAKAARTPMPEGYKPMVNDKLLNPELRALFLSLIGSLLYLMLGTRPDIAYAVTRLAQFSANPSQEHVDKAKYIFQYLVGTKNYALGYNGPGDQGLIGYTDSDYAEDPNFRRSITANIVMLAGCAISWRLRGQKTVAQSSTEAEYTALAELARQVIKLRKEVDWKREDKFMQGYLKKVWVEGEMYSVRDVILVPNGNHPFWEHPGEYGDPLGIPLKATIQDFFWFGCITFLDRNAHTAHLQWFEHGSEILFIELANDRQLFYMPYCESSIAFKTIVGKVNVHWNIKSKDMKSIDFHDFICNFMFNQHTGAFYDIAPEELDITKAVPPLDNCPSCLRHDLAQTDKESCITKDKRGFVNGFMYRGKKYHYKDFVLYYSKSESGKTGPADIGGSDIERILPGEVLRDERQLFITGETVKIPILELLGVVYVPTVNSLQQVMKLEDWVRLSPDHFYLEYQFPTMHPTSWNERKHVRWEQHNVCAPCWKDKLQEVKGLKEFLKDKKRHPLNTLDLFGGVGAFSDSLSQGSGVLKVPHAIKIMPSAAGTFKKNFPQAVVYNQYANTMLKYTVKTWEGMDVNRLYELYDEKKSVPPPPKKGSIKVITARFPCQAHSTLNMFKDMNNMKNNHVLNALLWVDAIQLIYAFFENVKGFLEYQLSATQASAHMVEGGIEMGGLKLMVRALLDMGYQVCFSLLQAAHYGTPQRRI
ncbi:hypothetical protein NMY22_g827 [Coprinellus aureogranulatus]|nr:hypothetical protein NMY22_g827 [Coprinellus aureogranulatus]